MNEMKETVNEMKELVNEMKGMMNGINPAPFFSGASYESYH
jgi:hypothetical protein